MWWQAGHCLVVSSSWWPAPLCYFPSQEKVMHGTSRAADYRAYRRIAPKSLELVVVSRPVAFAFCGRLLLQQPAGVDYFDPAQDWPQPIELHATFSILLEELATIGRTCIPWRYSKSMWAARVCAGQPGTAPIDDGHSPAQYSCAQNHEWTQDKTDWCFGQSAAPLPYTHRGCSAGSTWRLHAGQPARSSGAWRWTCPHSGSSFAPGDPHWPLWPMYSRRLWRWKNSLSSSSVDRSQLRTSWFLCCRLHQRKCRCESPCWPDQRSFPTNAINLWTTAGSYRGRKGRSVCNENWCAMQRSQQSHCGEAYSDCDWRISYCGNGHEIFIIQPVAFQDVASVYGWKPAVRQLSRNGCTCCHPTAGTYRICRGP